MKKIMMGCCLMLLAPAVAAEAPAQAQLCVACHGETGNKPIANYPKLAGQSEKYLLYAMNAYKDGSRPNAVMEAQAAGLSAEDIAELAAYYAAQNGDLQ